MGVEGVFAQNLLWWKEPFKTFLSHVLKGNYFQDNKKTVLISSFPFNKYTCKSLLLKLFPLKIIFIFVRVANLVCVQCMALCFNVGLELYLKQQKQYKQAKDTLLSLMWEGNYV